MHGVNTGFKNTRGARRSKAVKVAPEQVVKEESRIYEVKDSLVDFESGKEKAIVTTEKSFWGKIFG